MPAFENGRLLFETPPHGCPQDVRGCVGEDVDVHIVYDTFETKADRMKIGSYTYAGLRFRAG